MSTSLFEFLEYKKALVYLGRSSPRSARGFYRKLSEFLNVHPTLISQVLSGHRDFSEEQIIQVCDFFDLLDRETEYLLILLKIEKAGSHRLRLIYENQRDSLRQESLLKRKKENTPKALKDSELTQFYSDWLYSAVHMMATLQEKPDLDFMQNRMQINRTELQKVLNFLSQIEFIQFKGQVYYEGVRNTVLSNTSPYLRQHHTNWRLKALTKLGKKTSDEIIFTSNFSISKSDFLAIKKEIISLAKSVQDRIENSPAEDIAHLNIDLLWV
jgi:uncharacterized protein (TIGR02147 family)